MVLWRVLKTLSIIGCVAKQVEELVFELEQLSSITCSQPHVAYCAYIHRLMKSKWHYLARTIPNISDLLQPLEDTTRIRFIPVLTGRAVPGDLKRDMLSLPTRLGRLPVTNPTTTAEREHQSSLQITAILVSNIIHQRSEYQPHTHSFLQYQAAPAPKKASLRERASQQNPTAAPRLPKHSLPLASEEGASRWLTAQPL